MIYFQALDTGEATSQTLYDSGLRSTAENPKTLLSIILLSVALPHIDGFLQVWYEQEKIAEIPMSVINSRAVGESEPYGRNFLNEVEIGFTIPVGAVVKVATKAGATAQRVIGAYRYEITA